MSNCVIDLGPLLAAPLGAIEEALGAYEDEMRGPEGPSVLPILSSIAVQMIASPDGVVAQPEEVSRAGRKLLAILATLRERGWS